MATNWNITERMAGAATILQVTVRELSVEPASDGHQLLESIAGHVRDGRRTILINLRGADSIDSNGLAEIAVGFTRARDAGGWLAVCELEPKVRELFRITRLDTQIPVFETEREGLDAIRRRPLVPPT